MAVSSGVGDRLDLVLLWLWYRPAAAAAIQLPAWELSCALGVALKKTKTTRLDTGTSPFLPPPQTGLVRSAWLLGLLKHLQLLKVLASDLSFPRLLWPLVGLRAPEQPGPPPSMQEAMSHATACRLSHTRAWHPMSGGPMKREQAAGPQGARLPIQDTGAWGCPERAGFGAALPGVGGAPGHLRGP